MTRTLENLVLMFAIMISLAIVAILLTWALYRRRADRAARAVVFAGDFWELLDTRNAGLYEVVGPNTSTEAGSDSWQMRHTMTARQLWMHHDARTAGRWILCMRDGQPMKGT